MEGVKVVEFGTFIAGPLVTQQLKHFGAEVTCVRRPKHVRNAQEEYDWNPELYDSLGDGKVCIELDLKTSRGLNSAKRLIQSCHILVENFRPGVMCRLGLDPETCSEWNPSLIYVSLPGFSCKDPNAHVAAYESVILSKAGVFRDMGWNRLLMGVEASYSSLTLASTYGAIHAVFAILCVVYDQHRDANQTVSSSPSSFGNNIKGEVIEVPLISALIDSLIHNSVEFSKPLCYTDTRELCYKCGMTSLSYADLQTLGSPFYSHYWCADNRPLYIVAPAHVKHQTRLLQTLGLHDALDRLPVADAYETSPSGNAFGLGSNKMHNPNQMRTEIANVLKTRSSKEWEHILTRAQIACVAHRTTFEWMTSPHAQASGLVQWNNMSASAKLAPMCWIENERPCATKPLPRSLESCACLDGIVVVDLCNVIAGPTIGMMLSKMGATVVKIDPPSPLYSPIVTVVYGVCANRGKRAIKMDLVKQRSEFDHLLQTAHILTVNATYESLERLGLTEDAVYNINPNLNIVHFDAWGGPNSKQGALASSIGYDDNIQAGIGIMERFGGSLDRVEEHAHIGTIDVIAGVSGAAVAVLTLLKQRVKQVRCVGRTSLASVGQLLQLPMQSGTRRNVLRICQTLKNGVGIVGEHAFHRCYKTSDAKWMMLVASMTHDNLDKEWELKRILQISLPSITFPQRLDEEFLVMIFFSHTLDFWIGVFSTTSVVVTPLMSLTELKEVYIMEKSILDDQTSSYEGSIRFLKYEDHPLGTLTMAESLPIRMSHRSLTCISHAPHMEYSSSYLPYSTFCDVCSKAVDVLSKLPCGAKMCKECKKACSYIDNPTVISCRMCHNIHFLSNPSSEWKRNYIAWRRGKARGAHTVSRANEHDIHRNSSLSLLH